MLKTWRLRNFKSIREAELNLAPLTIFAGANSSGKSTFIQSILLISQTSASKVRSRTVVLNGHLTKLGQFDDLLSTGSLEPQISVGWTYEPTSRINSQRYLDRLNRVQRARALRHESPEINNISCDISIDVKPTGSQRDLLQLQPNLRSSSLSCSYKTVDEDRTSTVEVERHEASVREKIVGLPTGRYSEENSGLDFNVKLDEDSLTELREEFATSTTPVGCSFRHFLPDYLVVRYDETEEEARSIASVISEYQPRLRAHGIRRLTHRNILIPTAVIDLLKERLGDAVTPVLEPPRRHRQSRLTEDQEAETLTLRDWYERTSRLPPRYRDALYDKVKVDQQLADDILEIVKKQGETRGQTEDRFALRPHRLEYLSHAAQRLDRYFTTSVRYIGPLRDEPKPVYPLAAAEDPTDVGLKGEYTAAVLDLNRDRSVQYIPAANFAQAAVRRASSRATLEVAVLDWLRYLGVAEDVHTRDRGKLGHELQITSSHQGAPRDLTHVGVGVSQVLPVIVVCLLADQGSTLIFEQPELHLHPRVQTLLADFFLSMALLGKQCLVETHSEYLINRLRFRTASAPGNDLSKEMKTYFVEKQGDISSFREVVINEYGAILDWPEGFFDQSQVEAERILRAAVMKKKRERNNA